MNFVKKRSSVQKTIAKPVRFDGVGLHTGAPVSMVVRPAAADSGIVFVRTDRPAPGNRIAALWDNVVISPLATRIQNRRGDSVSTIEHIMAALAGTGIQNALIEVDGPEVPILDGSARPFVRDLMAAGQREQDRPVMALRILRPVEIRDGAALARLEPADGLEIDFAIDFSDRAIGRQQLSLAMGNGTFVRELSDCRTFCRKADIDAMHARGLALGGTLDNAVVVDGDRVVSPGGLRHADEAVRHKMLDALGDLATAGAPIIGRYVGVRSGHAMTNRLLQALFATPGAFLRTPCRGSEARALPGAELGPADFAAVA